MGQDTKEELSLDFSTLGNLIHSGKLRPSELVRIIYDRIEAASREGVWIYLRPRAEVVQTADELERSAGDRELPLYGLPFAVKDNIDVAGVPTTAGCPEFTYLPRTSAPVVTRLLDAGAIFVGKTNLDQFATGLVGTRSPYGKCRNPFNPEYIVGGSSSGSAFTVAAGLVSFALGTDTAGSGRVPAGFTNTIGFKPTRGLLSTSGVVPACRSLDCVSILALTVEDAAAVTAVAAGFDESDPYSRWPSPIDRRAAPSADFHFGVPDELEFFGDREAEQLFQQAIERLQLIGGTSVTIPFAPFLRTAELLYGPWVAERWNALRDFYENHADAFYPVTRQIIEKGAEVSGSDLFDTIHRLEQLRQVTAPEWKRMEVLLVPTTPSIYTIAEIDADPITLNTQLGYYTNFVNLLDYSAIAVPSGFRANGLPFGVTFIGPAWSENWLTELAAKYHRSVGGRLGATSNTLNNLTPVAPPPKFAEEMVSVAVVGAHLSGEPLNHQLTERNGRLLKRCDTRNCYRLYALDTVPPKPGLVRVESGASIAVEVWSIPERNFGAFISLIPSPLCIGSVVLADGEIVKGFLCEPYALAGAVEITHYGGWRAYRAALSQGNQNPGNH
jgi:allophanate hydrolase